MQTSDVGARAAQISRRCHRSPHGGWRDFARLRTTGSRSSSFITAKAMKRRSGLLGIGGALLVGLASAQPFDLGRMLSTEFLARLASPSLDGSNVVIVHSEAGSAMIVDRRAPRDRVVYLRGEGLLWAQIAEQLSERSGQGEPIRLDIRRWTLDAAACPSLESEVAAFLGQLDQKLADLDGASTETGEILLDAPVLSIQLGAKDALLTLTPNGALDPPLQRAALKLHSAVSRCAGSQASVVEQHDF